MSIKQSKRFAIQHHLARIQSIAASELAGLATQGPDGAREAIKAIEDNTTAILSVVEDPDGQWTDSADDTPEEEPTGTPPAMRLALSVFEIDEFGHRASSEDDDFRIVGFTPEDLLHIADCVSVGNDGPPADVSDDAMDAAFRFENALRETSNAAVVRHDSARES